MSLPLRLQADDVAGDIVVAERRAVSSTLSCFQSDFMRYQKPKPHFGGIGMRPVSCV